jgi:glycosyltransferase involved in cell wall biosynthesis
MNDLPDLTIVIPVKNEEANIAGCLMAIGNDFARKIVILDSGSTDETVQIARQFPTEIVQFSWNGQFPKKRNWYLRNCEHTTKWIMFLDADEYLTKEFKAEAAHSMKSDKYVGFWLNYTIYFLGKKLRGGYPLKKLALFQIGSGEYERIEEDKWSNLDMEIHEHPVLAGNIGTLNSKIDHQDFRGVSHYIKKHDEYSSWEASRFLKMHGNNQDQNSFTWKQIVKYRLMNSPFLGPVFFIGGFFLMGGFKDGSRGFTFAILKASYFTQIYCKIRELGVLDKK